uniref:Fimbrial assembly family protein n=1 Tax=Caulobacter sp. (strain K31) TaxID=366602 RepID=B0T7N5_CAUSK
MTARRVLDADLGEIVRGIQQGWAWWVGELSDMAPASWRRTLRRPTPWSVRAGQDGVLGLWRDGLPVGAMVGPPANARADLVLPPEAVLVRDLDIPRLSRADLNRLLTANMDRFTPFSADQVYFDARFVAESGDGKQRLRLAVIIRERARLILHQARSLGVEIARMGPEARDAAPPIDFLPAIMAAEGGGDRRRLTAWWTVCATLVALNILTAVMLDMRDVSRLRDVVEAEQPRVEAAGRMRQAVQAEQDTRLALLRRRSQNEPLRIIAALAETLPSGQWVQRFEWNGRTVRVVGFKTAGFDVPNALGATPTLTNPRSLLSDMPVKAANGREPFDVIADSSTRGPR